MRDVLNKFIIDVVVLGEETNAWQAHLVDELAQLKAVVEGLGWGAGYVVAGERGADSLVASSPF